MMTRDFDFELPDELIAQEPPAMRGDSRLLVLHRDSGQVDHTVFSRVADYLRRGDVLVLNNTKVFPARLLGYRLPGGGVCRMPFASPASDSTTSGARRRNCHQQRCHREGAVGSREVGR